MKKIENTNKHFLETIKDSRGNQIKEGSIVLVPDLYERGDKIICKVFWWELGKGGFWAIIDLINNAKTGFTRDTASEFIVVGESI